VFLPQMPFINHRVMSAPIQVLLGPDHSIVFLRVALFRVLFEAVPGQDVFQNVGKCRSVFPCRREPGSAKKQVDRSYRKPFPPPPPVLQPLSNILLHIFAKVLWIQHCPKCLQFARSPLLSGDKAFKLLVHGRQLPYRSALCSATTRH
jgi:hypothetical protein